MILMALLDNFIWINLFPVELSRRTQLKVHDFDIWSSSGIVTCRCKIIDKWSYCERDFQILTYCFIFLNVGPLSEAWDSEILLTIIHQSCVLGKDFLLWELFIALPGEFLILYNCLIF